jgi:hypothetical protein
MEIDLRFDDIEEMIARKYGSELRGLEYIKESPITGGLLECWYCQISRDIAPYGELEQISCGIGSV